MKFRLLPSPRLLLRAVRALERIAAATEDVRDATFRLAHIPTPVRAVVDDDTPDDLTVLYTTDGDTAAFQHRARTRSARGYAADADDAATVVSRES